MVPEITIETDRHIIYPDSGKIWNKRMNRYTGGVRKDGYLHFHLEGKKYLNHRYIYEMTTGIPLKADEHINHINNIRNDNRIENLEIVNYKQNNQWRDKGINNSSGFKGITWHEKNKKWVSRISLNNKRLFLGLFDDIREAANAYNLKAIELNENNDCHYKLIPLMEIINYKK